MDLDRPEPGIALNTGAPTVPRLAATVILLRGGARQLEVLLVRRNPAARVMGGAWVFPGGTVDPEDGEGGPALEAAAIRELAEEAGIELASSELVAFARWITPAQLSVRFDTWFFLASAPAGATPRVDGGEIVDFLWSSPADALAAAERDELKLVFPTIKQLQRLSGFASADATLATVREQRIEAVEPRVVRTDGRDRLVLPGEPGY